MPRCLCEFEGVKKLLLNVRMGNWMLDRFLEKIISLACFEGSGLKDIFQEYAHLDIKYRSSLSVTEAAILSFITENIDVSSAKKIIFDWIPSGISLMKIRKKRGPNIEPWGTPAKISFQFEV